MNSRKLVLNFILFSIFLFFFTFFLYPLFYVFIKSFYIEGKITFKFFPIIFSNRVLRSSIINSFEIAIFTTLLTAIISLPISFMGVKYSFRLKGVLQSLLLVPLILPPFVGAIGMKKIFARMGAFNLLLLKMGIISSPIDWFGDGGFLGVILLETLHLYPIMYLNLVAALSNIDPTMEEVAKNIGASKFKIFKDITLPLALPGFFAGAAIVFIWAFTDLGTPLIFDFYKTIPVQIFHMLTDINENPLGYVLVVLIIIITLAFFLLTKKIFGKKKYEIISKGITRKSEIEIKGFKKLFFILYSICLIFVALIPHLGVLLVSLSKNWFGTILPSHYTLLHFKTIFENHMTLISIKNSFFYSSFSTLLDIFLGITIGYILIRTKIKGRDILDSFVMLPLALPGIVLAFGYLSSFSGTVIDPRINPVPLLIISYGIRRLPYIVRSVYAGFQQLSKFMEEASYGLGAGKIFTFRKITLPLISANILAGALLCFAYAMLEVSDSLILALREKFFPITKTIYILFNSVSGGFYIASALGILGMVILTCAILIGGKILGKKFGEMFRI